MQGQYCFGGIRFCDRCLVYPACVRCILIIIISVLNQWNGFFLNKSRVIHAFIFSVHFPFLVVLNKRKNKCMGNCLSKFNDKSLTLHTPPLTSRNIKKLISGMRKSTVKYFATGLHQKYGYERITQSIKSSLRIHMTDFLHNLLRY